MLTNILKAIFGKAEKASETTKAADTLAASNQPTTEATDTKAEELAKVEAMTTTEAVAKIREQFAERRNNRPTTAKALANKLAASQGRAARYKAEAEALADTDTEKKKVCAKLNAELWAAEAEELAKLLEAAKAKEEAEALAAKALEEKAAEALAALTKAATKEAKAEILEALTTKELDAVTDEYPCVGELPQVELNFNSSCPELTYYTVNDLGGHFGCKKAEMFIPVLEKLLAEGKRLTSISVNQGSAGTII